VKSRRLERIPARHRKDVEAEIRGLLRLIQERREKLGFTQEDLAERLEISAEAVQSIEQGRRFPSLPMLFYVLKLLKIQPRFE
jgi:transcriptional regulator with XRE-family HTH domain